MYCLETLTIIFLQENLSRTLSSINIDDLLAGLAPSSTSTPVTNDGPRVWGQRGIPEGKCRNDARNDGERLKQPDEVPDGAGDVLHLPVRCANMEDPGDLLVRIIGQDRGAPALLVSNPNVDETNRHLYETIIGFSRDAGDVVGPLMRNGMEVGEFVDY